MIRFATALAALAALPLPAAAQEVVLKLNVPPGTRIASEEASDFTMAMKLTVAGQAMDLDQKVASTTTATMEVLEIGPDGVPTRASVSFDAASQTSATAMGQAQEAPHPLAGKTVTLTRGGDGVTVEPDPGLDEAARAELVAFLDLSRAELPGRAVAVGESWPGSIASVPGEETGQATFTLDGVRTAEGREVADISVRLDFAGDMDGAKVSGRGAGQGVLDVATGLWLDSALEVSGSFDGAMQESGVEAQVAGTMTGKTTYRGRIDGAGGGEGEASPVAEGGSAQAAATPPAEAQTYTDGALTLVLTGDEVAITLGGQNYPGRVTSRSGDSLSGTFTASGTAFPFEARREGDGLVLTSGGTTYTLAPEDVAEEAPNPLAGQ